MTPSGETSLQKLLQTLKPRHNPGQYVFCTVSDPASVGTEHIVMLFKEDEGVTVIVKKDLADQLHLRYDYVASWITLTVHSSLAAVGLTAAFSQALSTKGISCNVVAAFHHDHLFVDQKDTEAAMDVLARLSD
jgi:hypothetical protein